MDKVPASRAHAHAHCAACHAKTKWCTHASKHGEGRLTRQLWIMIKASLSNYYLQLAWCNHSAFMWLPGMGSHALLAVLGTS